MIKSKIEVQNKTMPLIKKMTMFFFNTFFSEKYNIDIDIYIRYGWHIRSNQTILIIFLK